MSKKPKPSDYINGLYKIAKFRDTIFRDSPTAMVEYFGEGDDTVSFESVGVLKEFDIITSTLYSINGEIQNNYTQKEFVYNIVDILRKLRIEQREATKEDWNNLISILLERPDLQLEIAVPIHGVLLQNNSIQLGDFNIYKKHALSEKYPEFNNYSSPIANSDIYASHYVTAKSVSKCREIAEKKFFSFENISNFITAGFHKTHKISLLNHRSYEQLHHLVFHDNHVLSGGKTLHRFEPVKIENPIYISGSNKIIWDFITITRNGLQDKILESMEWSGMASVETDDNKALLLYLIAIESILNYSEKAELYVPVSVSLADSVAFLLGKNKKSRKQYAKHIFELYGKRSAIVHGSKKHTITELDLHTAFSLSHQIIRKILTEEPYKSFKSKKDLSDYLLKEKKYEMGDNADTQ